MFRKGPGKTVKVTSSGSVWLAFSAASILGGILLGAPFLAVLGIWVALSIGCEEFYVRLVAARCLPRRYLPSEVTQGAWVKGRLEFPRGRWLPLFWGVVDSPLGLDLDRGCEVTLPPLLPPFREARIDVGGYCHVRRGAYMLDPAWLRFFGPLGLVQGRIPIEGSREVLVLPRVERFSIRALVDWRQRAKPPSRGRAVGRKGAAGQEPRAVREYRPGDRMRDIHWKQTARMGGLYSIERERTAMGSSVIWPDLFSYSDDAGMGVPPALSEEVVRVAASIGWNMIRTGIPTSLMIASSEETRVEMPVHGSQASDDWLRTCARLTCGSGMPPLEALNEILEGHVVVPKGQIIPIFGAAFWPPKPLLECLSAMQFRGWQVTPLLVDDLSQQRAFDFRRSKWRHDRSALDLLAALENSGITAALVPVGARLDQLMTAWNQQGRRGA